MKEAPYTPIALDSLPGRVDAATAAKVLGFSTHDIPILIAAGLIKPLGHPAPNAPKYFAAATLRDLHDDAKWLARACDAVREHWWRKNCRGRQERPATAQEHVDRLR
jgi:hypothetical protein